MIDALVQLLMDYMDYYDFTVDEAVTTIKRDLPAAACQVMNLRE